MDAFSDPLIETVTMMTSGQVGKTEIINNIVGFYVHQDPSPILVIQPTIEMGQAWSKDRVAPMLRDTPCLQGKVKDARSRDSQNTILHKTFTGGHLTIAGANSPASLASRPIRVVLLDEVDRFPPSAGTEGDPVSLAIKRTKNFFNRKIMLTSTPTITGVSRIEHSWSMSDQRHFFVPCPKCGAFQKLLFSRQSKFANISGGQLKYDSANCSWVYYECESCKAELIEADKYRMVRHGRWEVNRPDVQNHAGFHLNELYSPWSTWLDVVREFLDKKQRRESLQVFVNTTLGETWDEEEAYTIDDSSLMSRRESYAKIPEGVYLLTAGVDTQDDRLECAIKGWGLNNESWLIGYHVFYGSPALGQTWQLLDDLLHSEFECENGVKLRIMAACVDSAGHFTQEVYKFTRPRQHRRIFSIVGRGGIGKPLIGKATRGNRERAIVIPIGVDDAKSVIYSRLRIQTPGPGYMHFPMNVAEDYFRQLTAEKQVIVRSKGFQTKVWRLKAESRRNEALDCEAYAMAAMAILNPNMDALKRRYEQDLARVGSVEAQVQPEEQSPLIVPTPFRRRKNWVTGF